MITDVRVYPNPVGNVINLNINGLENGDVNTEIRLLNLLGQSVYMSNYAGISHVINVAEFPDGYYMLIVAFDDKIISKQIAVAR